MPDYLQYLSAADPLVKPGGPTEGNRFWLAQAKFDTKDNPRSANEVVRAISIPAGTYVDKFFLVATTGEGGTCSVDVGDDDDSDLYEDAHSVANAGVGVSTPARFYSSDNTVSVKFNNAADAAVFTIYMILVDTTITNSIPPKDFY